jgi:cell division protein FtsN
LFREKSDEVKKIVTGTGHEKTATDKAKVTAQRVRPVTEKERPMVVRSQPVNNARAADAMRAKLLLSGFEARSYRYRDSNGLMRYRVEVGPFSQKDAAETARAQLARYGTAGQIEPL